MQRESMGSPGGSLGGGGSAGAAVSWTAPAHPRDIPAPSNAFAGVPVRVDAPPAYQPAPRVPAADRDPVPGVRHDPIERREPVVAPDRGREAAPVHHAAPDDERVRELEARVQELEKQLDTERELREAAERALLRRAREWEPPGEAAL